MRAELLEATDEELDKALTYPGMSFAVYEMVSFDSYREANCIGRYREHLKITMQTMLLQMNQC